jgi:hypothetical protein
MRPVCFCKPSACAPADIVIRLYNPALFFPHRTVSPWRKTLSNFPSRTHRRRAARSTLARAGRDRALPRHGARRLRPRRSGLVARLGGRAAAQSGRPLRRLAVRSRTVPVRPVGLVVGRHAGWRLRLAVAQRRPPRGPAATVRRARRLPAGAAGELRARSHPLPQHGCRIAGRARRHGRHRTWTADRRRFGFTAARCCCW